MSTEIDKSIKERSHIHAIIYNSKKHLNYYKSAVKSEILPQADAIAYSLPSYNELLSIEWLVNKYSELWLEKFSEIKLKYEKFINSQTV